MAPSPRDASPQLQDRMDDIVDKVTQTIGRLLPDTDLAEAPLYEAMRYGTLNGGKRLQLAHRLSGLARGGFPRILCLLQASGGTPGQ